jgi:hypothetical protein
MKNVTEMTREELEAAATKLQEQAAKRKAYSASKAKKPLTDVQKAKRLEYGRNKRANDKAILAKASELGLGQAKAPTIADAEPTGTGKRPKK